MFVDAGFILLNWTEHDKNGYVIWILTSTPKGASEEVCASI